MTLPRHLLSGETYLVTRRTEARKFSLIPDDEMRNAYFYLLAFATRINRIDVHLAQLMSDHEHLIQSAPSGGMPKFLEMFHFQVQRAVNKIRGWKGKVWEAGKQTSLVKLLDKNAIADKALYVEMNPVKAGMVKSESKWPGLVRERVTMWKKPAFLNNPLMMDEETLTLKEPPGFDSWEEWMETLNALRDDARSTARAQRKEDAKAQNRVAFLGLKRSMKISPFFKPNTPDGYGKRNPRFASRCRETLKRAYEDFHAFLENHERAHAELRKNGTAEFPIGTWKMAILLGQLSLS